jgi:RNA polymerase sigma-70 factor (ECF subfamily)
MADHAHDADLIARSVNGDRSAFSELVAQHRSRILSVCRSVTRSDEDAQDVAQEVLLTLWKKLSLFDGGSRLDTWIYRIAFNAAIDHVRMQRHRRSEELLDEHASPVADPQTALERKNIVEELNAAMDRLQPIHYVVVFLREVEGLSYEQIADRTGVPKGTVMSRLHHARHGLQQILRDRLSGDIPDR